MIEWLQNDASIQLLKNIAMVLFFVVFSGVVLWLLLRKNSEIRRWSRIPLEDSAVHDQSQPKEEDGQSP